MCGLPTVVMLACGVVTIAGEAVSQVGAASVRIGVRIRIRVRRRRQHHRRRQDAEHDRVALLGARAAVVGGDDGERKIVCACASAFDGQNLSCARERRRRA